MPVVVTMSAEQIATPFTSSSSSTGVPSIEYALPEQAHVQLTIYDIQGRLIETLVDSKQPAGHHQVIWGVKNTPSGIYLYRLTAGNLSETRKMLLIK